jgi:Ca2+-binding RTX toxin-like protein
MVGGAGDDTYIVDSTSDVVTENSSEGTDTVQSSSISLDISNYSNVENLTLTGSSNLNLTGNSSNDTLTGNSGNNTLDGGSGNDTMIGGTGDDIYVVDSTSDVVTENSSEGTDIVQSSSISLDISNYSNIEKLMLTGSSNLNLTGNSSDNILMGNDGNNTLDGGSGNDRMYGGAGDDTYVVDSTFDTVTESSSNGTDTVQSSSINLILSNYSNVENLTLTGSSNLNLIGGSGNNTLTGNSGDNEIYSYQGNDTLDGGSGDDIMVGGTGDDTYVVDSTSDTVTENSSEGTDTIQSSVSYTVSSNVENLTLTGSTNIDATGNSEHNTLTGNSGNNEIDGNGGTDTVVFNDTKANVISSFGYHHNNASAIVIKGTYGTDTIVDCENIQFSDGTISVADLKNEFASNFNPLFANSTTGEASYMMADTYSGTVSGVQWQYLAQIGTDANTVVGSTGNDFINLLGGDDAAVGGKGDDIIDGGRGSNFLTGGAGTDTFFLDGRGSSSVIWSTITDWDNTEKLSVWGWGSSSTISWEENQGASGFEGATFSIDLNGNGVVDLKCTFTGLAVADIKTPTEFVSSDLLWFT